MLVIAVMMLAGPADRAEAEMQLVYDAGTQTLVFKPDRDWGQRADVATVSTGILRSQAQCGTCGTYADNGPWIRFRADRGISKLDTQLVCFTEELQDSDDDAVACNRSSVKRLVISTEDGDDSVSVLAASLPVEIRGGNGDDHIEGENANDVINGGRGNDTIFGDSIHAAPAGPGPGQDTINGGPGHDKIQGGPGNDEVIGGPYGGSDPDNDVIRGGPGGDQLYGARGRDDVIGEVGQDTLRGHAGQDRLFGQDDSDSLDGGTSSDLLVGGSGTGDVVIYASRTGNVSVSLHSSHGTLKNGERNERDRIFELESAVGGSGDDTLVGSSRDNLLDGRNGGDFIVGKEGADLLTGELAHDVIIGGSGDDTLLGRAGRDVMLGGHGHDDLDGGLGDDKLNGQSGNDNLDGWSGIDTLYGDGLPGTPGNDNVKGGGSSDILDGGGDDDTLDGGEGPDTISGLSGSDTVTYSNRIFPLVVTLNDSNTNDGDTTDGSSFGGGSAGFGDRDMVLPDVENVVGGVNADHITGNHKGNRLDGGPLGANSLFGLGGFDALVARDGSNDRTLDCGLPNPRSRLTEGEPADTATLDALPRDADVRNCERVLRPSS